MREATRRAALIHALSPKLNEELEEMAIARLYYDVELPLTPPRFLNRAALLYGDKVGIVDGAQRFTFGEYKERIHRLAQFQFGLHNQL